MVALVVSVLFLYFCLFFFFFALCGPSVLSKNRRVLRLSVHSPSSFATLPGSSSLCQCLSCRTKKNAGKSKSLSVNSFMTHCSKKQVGSQKERHFLKNRDLFPRQLGFWEMPSVMSAAFAKFSDNTYRDVFRHQNVWVPSLFLPWISEIFLFIKKDFWFLPLFWPSPVLGSKMRIVLQKIMWITVLQADGFSLN